MGIGIRELQVISKILIIFCSFAAFAVVFSLNGRIRERLDALRSKRNKDTSADVNIVILPSKLNSRIETKMHATKQTYFSYERIDKFLKQNGAGFISGYFINPVNFMFLKCLLAVVFAGVAFLTDFSLPGCLIAAVAGFFVLDYLLYAKNRTDNRKMLADIERANETIKMYGEVSGTLYGAVYECYKFSENERLKRGFFELYGELQMTHSYERAIDHFLEKFNNDYLRTLARNIEQAGVIGFNESLLSDMSKDMAELQREQNYNYRAALKTKWSIILLLSFIIMLAVCIYGMMGSYFLGNTGGII